jgi:hypothetical protein
MGTRISSSRGGTIVFSFYSLGPIEILVLLVPCAGLFLALCGLGGYLIYRLITNKKSQDE